jgi:hypothetical protein
MSAVDSPDGLGELVGVVVLDEVTASAGADGGDSSRAGFRSLLRGLTRSDVITHSAHPAGPQPGVSGQKHRSWNSPVVNDDRHMV